MASDAPPAGNGLMIRIILEGDVWAHAAAGAKIPAATIERLVSTLSSPSPSNSQLSGVEQPVRSQFDLVGGPSASGGFSPPNKLQVGLRAKLTSRNLGDERSYRGLPSEQADSVVVVSGVATGRRDLSPTMSGLG